MAIIDHGIDALVLVDETSGITVIPQLSELRRLNWFDGKLLRADDLRIEQDHMRGLVRRSSRAGGRGVVHGFTCRLAQDARLRVGPGLAIDPSGRSLLLPVDVALDVEDLIERTAGRARSERPARKLRHRALGRRVADDAFADCVEPEIAGQAPVGSARWYVVTVGWAEGLCGNEEVYGRLCEDACTTSTDRPWRIDGLVFRAHPLTPRTPLPTSTAVALSDVHERSMLASAVFADELADAGSLISSDGLRSPVWCAGAGPGDPGRDEVPIGVIARAGGTTRFLDLWIARRERMIAPPQRWWEGRLAMRPWDVFLAQVLQFQCQLTDLLLDRPGEGTGGHDPCAERQEALEETFAELERRSVHERSAEDGDDDPRMVALRRRVVALRAASIAARGERRILVDGGIVELPPAGYLPVDPAGPASVEDQVRALLGRGVDLTFCAARHDALARAFEESRHLDRISLLRGLDDPALREDVEIVVPDAEVEELATRDAWRGLLRLGPQSSEEQDPPLELEGLARIEHGGAYRLRGAGAVRGPAVEDGDDDQGGRRTFGYAEVTTERDPFTAREGDVLHAAGSGDVVEEGGRTGHALRVKAHATFKVETVNERPGAVLLRGTINGTATASRPDDEDGEKPETLVADDWPALLVRRRMPDGRVLAYLSVQPDDDEVITTTATWRPDVDHVEFAMHVKSIEDRRTSAAFAAQPMDFGTEHGRLAVDRDPDAAQPQHPARALADEALSRIERAMRDPGYAEDVRARLLPGVEDEGIRLRATREWVLFRRRAPLRCGPVAPPATRTETFAVYGTGGDSRTAINRRAATPRFAYLGQVAFTQGSPRLERGAEAVAQAWGNAVGEGTIAAAGVLRGAAGGDALGLRRVEALVDVLHSVTPRSPDLRLSVLQPEDLDLDARGADGIAVVVAGRAQEPTRTIEVAAVALDPVVVPAYARAVAAQRFESALEQAFEIPHVLGTVTFEAGSSQPARSAELDAVKRRFVEELGEVGVRAVDMYSVSGDDDAGPVAVRTERAAAIGDAIGDADEARAFDGEDPPLLDAARARDVSQRMIVVVAPESTVAAAVFALSPDAIDAYDRHLDNGDVPAALKRAFGSEIVLGPVRFVSDAAQPVSDDEVADVVSKYKSAIDAPVRRVDVFTVTGDPAGGDAATRAERGRVIEQALDGATETGRLFDISEQVYESTEVAPERTIMLAVPVRPR